MLGTYEHVIDEKGRMFIPSKLRSELGCRFVLTKGVNRCLVAYPLKEWEAFEAKLNSFPRSEVAKLIRFFVGSAHDMEIDGQGRILVPQPLRAFAELEKNVMVVGASGCLEIWAAEAWTRGDVEPEEADAIMKKLGM